MKKYIFMIYGIISYLIFLVTFLYGVGFIGNFIVPKTIDYGYQGGTGYAILINILLLVVFAVQHSVMARQSFKKRWTKIIPKPVERSTYVLASSLVLILLFAFWRPIPGVLWNFQDTPVAPLLTALYFVGWLMVLVGTFLINHFSLFGLQQVYMDLKNRKMEQSGFVMPFLYKVVRHPMMLGFIIAFWATPKMTIGHLIFAAATTGYILVGIQLEERDLVEHLGEDYRRYQEKVPQIIPGSPTQEIEVMEESPANAR